MMRYCRESPGLEGIERCTNLDIAGAVIEYIAAQVDFPEVDVRERLTVSKGYGASEIYTGRFGFRRTHDYGDQDFGTGCERAHALSRRQSYSKPAGRPRVGGRRQAAMLWQAGVHATHDSGKDPAPQG